MTHLIRRTLLVSSTALAALVILPLASDFAPTPISALVQQHAEARGGDDDGDNDNSDDSSNDDDDDSSDRDRDRDRDRSDDDGDDDDDRDDDDNDDDDRDDDGRDDDRRGRGGDRDEIRVIVNERQLNGLRTGSMIPVDQNGKRLSYEFEQEHGNTEIKVRAPQGTLTGVTIIPAP